MKAAEFYNHVSQLSDSYQNRDLEDYLLALYKIVEKNKTKELTNDLIIEIIKCAIVNEPMEFQEEWLVFKTAPDKNRMSKKFTNSEIHQLLVNQMYLI